ncbi:MAG TPA: nuclear transport factor 2 family protein [Terriglobales bacterium]|nr:nuclear transport factor 2 family protein [Terriglobales bacterium]
MKCLCVLLLMVSAALAQSAPPAPSAPKPPQSPAPVTYDEAVANEKKLFAADQAHDLDTIKSIIADDFVDIGRDGSSIGKDALLKEIPGIKLLRYEQHNFRVTALGPFAYAISYDSDATAIGADGKESRSQNGLNSVWVRRDGRWQMLMHCRGAATSPGAH